MPQPNKPPPSDPTSSAGQLDIQPTITVRPGFRLNILVGRDIVLEPYR